MRYLGLGDQLRSFCGNFIHLSPKTAGNLKMVACRAKRTEVKWDPRTHVKHVHVWGNNGIPKTLCRISKRPGHLQDTTETFFAFLCGIWFEESKGACT